MIFNIPYADIELNNKTHANEVSRHITLYNQFSYIFLLLYFKWPFLGHAIPTNSKYLQFIDNGIDFKIMLQYGTMLINNKIKVFWDKKAVSEF